MRLSPQFSTTGRLTLLAAIALTAVACAEKDQTQVGGSQKLKPAKTVSGLMQARPGGPLEDVEVEVHEVPVDLPIVAAGQANLKDSDLVIGVVQDGEAVAYPIRYISNYEVLDSKVGKTLVAPTW